LVKGGLLTGKSSVLGLNAKTAPTASWQQNWLENKGFTAKLPDYQESAGPQAAVFAASVRFHEKTTGAILAVVLEAHRSCSNQHVFKPGIQD
jgi:hypothetical protein